MAANNWRSGPDLERQLFEAPQRLEFYQAVRLLETMHGARARVGDPDSRLPEIVRFESAPELNFQASDIVSLKRGDDAKDEPHTMTVSFFGLAGANGPLPPPFTELLLERMKRKDRGIKSLLDIFNNRLVAALYRAHKIYHPGFETDSPASSRYARYLFSILGLGTPGTRNRMGVHDQALLPFVGLLAHRPKSAVALERLVSAIFGVPVKVRQFVGHWHELDEATHTRLSMQPRNNVLGDSAVLGTKAWVQDNRVEVVLGPLDLSRFNTFLPLDPTFIAVASVIRLHVGQLLEVRMRLTVKKEQVPPLVLAQPELDDPGPLLGWTTWLGSGKPKEDDEQVVLTLHHLMTAWG
jgi:type VI secretion system protein ImpH